MAKFVSVTVEFPVPTEDYREIGDQRRWSADKWKKEIKYLFEHEHTGLSDYGTVTVVDCKFKDKAKDF